MKGNDHCGLYAVIGNPITHSRSPEIHQYFAACTGRSITYTRLTAPLDSFVEVVQGFIAQGGQGANITAPFKPAAAQLATVLTPRAKAAMAVNTLTFSPEGIAGDNTDGVGFVKDITQNAGMSLHHKRILILGAGGAAQGVLLPLLNESPQRLVLVNRTINKAIHLVQQWISTYPHVASILQASCLSDLPRIEGTFDLIINAMSTGVCENSLILAPSLLTSDTLAYDMNYANSPTAFMTHAQRQGAKTRDGLGMFIEQAAEAFFVWHGTRPETQKMDQQLRSLTYPTASPNMHPCPHQ